MNKGNVKMDELKTCWITAAEVHNRIEEILGFPVQSDFAVINGGNPFDAYVRMRIAMDDKYALPPADKSNYVDEIIAATTDVIEMRESVKNKLEKFMYPQDMQDLQRFIMNQNPQNLVSKGLYGNNLIDIVNHSKPLHNRIYKQMLVYLRPEAILRDIVMDPTDDDPGEFSITDLRNDSVNGVRWKVQVLKRVTKQILSATTSATIDTFYKTL